MIGAEMYMMVVIKSHMKLIAIKQFIDHLLYNEILVY